MVVHLFIPLRRYYYVRRKYDVAAEKIRRVCSVVGGTYIPDDQQKSVSCISDALSISYTSGRYSIVLPLTSGSVVVVTNDFDMSTDGGVLFLGRDAGFAISLARTEQIE